jgi:hypothetical protein
MAGIRNRRNYRFSTERGDACLKLGVSIIGRPATTLTADRSPKSCWAAAPLGGCACTDVSSPICRSQLVDKRCKHQPVHLGAQSRSASNARESGSMTLVGVGMDGGT